MKKFSFITPIYGDSYKNFQICYQAIKDQDYTNWEIIVVLDGPNKKATKYFKKYDVKLYEITHGGAPKARNYGVEQSTGDYILLTDPDIYLYPGTLTEWAEALEDNPDYGYVYGHYDLRGVGQTIVAREWNEYDLSCSNFISGMSPIRREVWIPQDETRKCLQDWDMWLTLAENEVKGKFINKSFFITEPPTETGISAYSHKNWERETTLIRNKHKNPKSSLVVTSSGAYHHAIHIAQKLGVDVLPDPNFKSHSYKSIYLIGWYPEATKQYVQMFKKFDTKIVHFIGGDIWKFRNRLNWEALQELKNYFQKEKIILLTETKHTYDELKEMGIETKIVPIPPAKLQEIQPLPKKFVVANYINPTQDVYYEDFMTGIAKNMPDIEWKFFGDKNKVFTDGNIEYVGWVDMDEFIPKCSALVRLTIHDGLPLGPLEFITAGRNVLTNNKFPHINYCKISKDEIVVRDDVVAKIREMQTKPLNIEGSIYWKEKLKTEKYVKAIFKYCHPSF